MADAQPWPQKFLMKSFPYAVHDSTTGESVFYGPYMRLLYHFPPLDGPFEIIPQFRVLATPRDSVDSVVTFTVELNKHPVLFILIKLLAPFRLDSKRQEADRQMRERFRDLHSDVVTPALPGIGTLLSFYRHDKATKSLTSPPIAADPNIMTDAVPKSLWDCEILDAASATRFREMVNEVKGDVCSYRNIPQI